MCARMRSKKTCAMCARFCGVHTMECTSQTRYPNVCAYWLFIMVFRRFGRSCFQLNIGLARLLGCLCLGQRLSSSWGLWACMHGSKSTLCASIVAVTTGIRTIPANKTDKTTEETRVKAPTFIVTTTA